MLNAHALLIGVAKYRHISALPPVVCNDVDALAALLQDTNRCGYPCENVRVLLDEDATRARLLAELAALAQRTTPESCVFLYFSGHGGRIEAGPAAGEYLLPVDTRAGPEAQLAATALSGAEFTAALRALPAQKVLVALDCCHAGGIGAPKTAGPTFKTGLPHAYYDALVAGRGRVILASSRSDEVSWALSGAKNSLFTQELLAGLSGGVSSDDGFIRLFDLFEYLQPRVTAACPQQHPVFKAEVEENFPLALYLGGQKGYVARDETGFRYDAYISYADRDPDAAWVWETLQPRLLAAGLRVAVSGDVEQPGVARVVNVERGIRAAKRTVVVLSENYLADAISEFEATLAQTLGLLERSYRLLPVQFGPLETNRLPTHLSMLTTLDLAHPQRAEREFTRLIAALQGPLPYR